MKYLIVGIDSGTKTGIAILDLKGKVVELFSSKNMGVDKTIQYITSKGSPSIIASDVSPAPNFLSKIASKLGCPLFTPTGSLSKLEKNGITREFGADNSHQRDALAAALILFNRYKNQFQKIDKLNLGDKTKHRLLQGMRITPRVTRKAASKRVKSPSNRSEDLKNLEKRYTALKEELKRREMEIEDLTTTLVKVRRDYTLRLRLDLEIKKRDNGVKNMGHMVDKLQQKLERVSAIKKIWDCLVNGSIVPVGVFPLSYDGLTLIKKRLKKKDLDSLDGITIAFTNEPKNIKLLKDKGIHVADNKYVQDIQGCYFITAEDFLKIRESKEVYLERIVEDYRKRV